MRKTLSEPVAPRKKRGRQMIGDEKRASISATLSKESFDTMDKIVKAGFAKSYSMSIDHALAFYEANHAKMQFDLPKEIKSKIIFEAYKAGLSPDQYIAQLLSTSKI